MPRRQWRPWLCQPRYPRLVQTAQRPEERTIRVFFSWVSSFVQGRKATPRTRPGQRRRQRRHGRRSPSFLFLSAMQHSPQEYNEREAPMTILRTLAPFLAAAIVLAVSPAQAEMKHQWVEYNQGGTKLKAYLVYDDKVTGRRPAVLMIHAREGMTPKTQSLAEIWAKLGYVTFAADIFGYGEGVLPKDVPEMQAQIAIYDKDRSLMRARTQAAFDVLVKNAMVDPSRIALIGYCFGGGVGIEFAGTGAPLVANVAIHGSFRDRAPGWTANAKGMFLILHGAEDAGFPLTTVNRLVDELRSAKIGRAHV